MDNILQHLARLYQRSAYGRKDSITDYTIHYEDFLRKANRADGDDREVAERELLSLEKTSQGLLSIDRQKRSGLPQRLRLARDGGEAWLFAQIGAISPHQQRIELAQFFHAAAVNLVPEKWQAGWQTWFRQLASAAVEGGIVQPFLREDAVGNQELIRALSGILHWSFPALVRYASATICGDSKKLQRLEARLKPALLAITGSDSLEAFGILHKPRWVGFHGSITMRIGKSVTDFGMFPAPIMLAETNFTSETSLSTDATICLTVENGDTFHELCATNPGIILIHTSYVGAGVRKMLSLLPGHLTFFHFGDHDPAGADILRDLREKTKRDIQLLVVPDQTFHARQSLRDSDMKMLHRLLDADLPTIERDRLIDLIENGIPNNFEQESIAISAVWKALSLPCL